MKVLIIEIWPNGGTAQYAAELARGLHESKADKDKVYLVVPTNFSPIASGYELCKELTELAGARVGGKVGNLLSLLWRRHRQSMQICRKIDQIRPDIIHIMGTSAAGKGLFKQVQHVGGKSVVTVHDLRAGSGAGQFFFRLWSKHFTLADHIIVHGKWSQSQIQSQYGPDVARRTSIMPIGVYDYGKSNALPLEVRRRYGLPQEDRVILFFGSLRRNKGLEVLIDALAHSSAKFHLFVAGQRPAQSEPSVEWYQHLAGKVGVGERITWLIRYIEDREVPDIFSSVDAVALPYTKSFAGQSSVLSVAATYGVPVLASEVGDIGETVRDCNLGLCVEPESPKSLATALESEIFRHNFHEKNGAQEFARASQWESIGNSLWKLYRNLPVRQS